MRMVTFENKVDLCDYLYHLHTQIKKYCHQTQQSIFCFHIMLTNHVMEIFQFALVTQIQRKHNIT